MNIIIRIAIALVAVSAVIGIAWRFESRRRLLPCPAWLSSLLENPYINAVAGSSTLLDRGGVREGMRLLDVGCGPGRLTILGAQKVGPTGEVIALDLQASMLQKLQDRAKKFGLTNVQPIHGAIGQGLLGKMDFDRAFLVTVLGEIPQNERTAALKEIRDALKPDGILSVTEVFPDPHYQTRTRVIKLCEAAGFKKHAEFGNWLAFTVNFLKQ